MYEDFVKNVREGGGKAANIANAVQDDRQTTVLMMCIK